MYFIIFVKSLRDVDAFRASPLIKNKLQLYNALKTTLRSEVALRRRMRSRKDTKSRRRGGGGGGGANVVGPATAAAVGGIFVVCCTCSFSISEAACAIISSPDKSVSIILKINLFFSLV